MDRFVVFLWDPASAAQTEQVTHWRAQLRNDNSGSIATIDHPGLLALGLPGSTRSFRPVLFEGLEGCLIGSAFERGNEPAGRVELFGGRVSDSIAQSQGRKLTHDYWGDYTALWRTPGASIVEVLRDPCGATPCFRTNACGIDILCSQVSDIASLPGIAFSTDWQAVNAFLTSGYFVTQHTGLSELKEILPGQRMTWRPGAAPCFTWAWNAAELAASPVKQAFADATAEIRTTAETCMDALAADYGSIVVRTSGGLDSSIVASLAARACPGRVTALHIIGRGYETYEQELARLAATKAGIELVEVEVGGASIDIDGAIGLPRTARPSRQVLSTSADVQLIAACKGVQAECVMTGHGGDGLFLQRSLTTDVFGDYLRLNGPGPRALRVAYDCASLLEQSIWSIFKRGIASSAGLRRWNPLALSNKAETPDGSPDRTTTLDQGYMLHDWLAEARSLPPCKAEQLRSIVALSLYYPMLGHGLAFDTLNPLASQPIVELALRTPAYQFIEGGRDRSLQRAAFADLLPPEVVRRTQKGFINHRLQSDVTQLTRELREFLLEGHLLASGHVDRTQTERLLSDNYPINDAELDALFTMLAAESWLISWRARA